MRKLSLRLAPRRSLRQGLLSLAGLAALTLGACDDHCAELEVKVCDKLQDKVKCELIREPERRKALSDAACEGMLKAQPR